LRGAIVHESRFRARKVLEKNSNTRPSSERLARLRAHDIRPPRWLPTFGESAFGRRAPGSTVSRGWSALVWDEVLMSAAAFRLPFNHVSSLRARS
ncbi:MAG: hypothetical protein KDA59_06715, partial [Planctomycetales bacterium]|nr:hypothetical protein [Planctomycetales bacterium]